METSAKEATNVNEAFELVITKIYEEIVKKPVKKQRTKVTEMSKGRTIDMEETMSILVSDYKPEAAVLTRNSTKKSYRCC